ncbi:SGNH/GDSL hydrolase family protein [Burkholderia stagnalis]|uniref:SGNH/GDSL hydrolase family protein n=1 Tax=Burkholderia stagnalis TaxID=1503054 RepID=UPI001624FF47|nr:SGNH/GDSL hydrolase family protein [Burkholderia stagnalis]
MKKIALAVIAAALAACGGGNGAPQTAAAATAQVSAVIETYGDSTTQGWESINGNGFITTANVPALLQAGLQAQFGAGVTVSNQAVGGTEASQLLNGTDGVHAAWAQQMAASPARIVMLNFSLNDAYYIRVPKSGVIGEAPADYAAYMTQLVQIAKAAGKTVVLVEPNPTCEPVRQSALADYVAQLRQVATAQGVMLVPHYDPILNLPNWQAMLTDCLHPSDALYAIKANRELPILAAMLR